MSVAAGDWVTNGEEEEGTRAGEFREGERIPDLRGVEEEGEGDEE